MIKRTLAALAAAATFALPVTAHAGTVTITYSGTITQVGADLDTTLDLLGTSFSGTMIIPHGTTFAVTHNRAGDTRAAHYITRYTPLDLSVTIGGLPRIEMDNALLALEDSKAGSATLPGQSNEDLLRISDTTSTLPTGISGVDVRLPDSTGTVFDSGLFGGVGPTSGSSFDRPIPPELLALGPNVDLTRFDADRFPDFLVSVRPATTQRGGFDGNSMFGNCPEGSFASCDLGGNVTAMSITVTPVPVPAGGVLLAGGLIAAAALRRRAHRKAA